MSEQLPPDQAWPAAEHPAELGNDAVHVWSAPLAIENALERRFESWLSLDERSRAARFHFPRDRARFIACRGRLRAMLSGYTGIAPARITFDYGPHGKPSLGAPPGAPPIHFNVSHSDDLAVFAFRLRGPVGIDVERLRTVEEAESIARRYFTERESATLRELASERRTEAFFRAWTRKEALLKAVGVGLSFSLSEVEVTLHPDEPAALLDLPQTELAGDWRIIHIAPAPGYLGALAAEQLEEVILPRQWKD